MSLAGTLQWEWVDGDVYECKERRDTCSVGVRRKRKWGRGEKRENEGITLYNMLPVCKGNESGVPHWGFIICQNNPFQHPPLSLPDFPEASTLTQTSLSAEPEDWQLPQKESLWRVRLWRKNSILFQKWQSGGHYTEQLPFPSSMQNCRTGVENSHAVFQYVCRGYWEDLYPLLMGF